MTTAYRRELLPNRTRASQLQREHNHTPNPDPNTQGETHPTTVQEHLPNFAQQDSRPPDIRGRIRHNEGRESTQFSPGKSFCVYVLPKLTDAMPPIKRVVPLFHSITTPTKPSSQRGRSTSIHSTGKDCTGQCSAARWGAERPEKSGVPENNIPGP